MQFYTNECNEGRDDYPSLTSAILPYTIPIPYTICTRVEGQMPSPKECNSTLMSGSSTLTSGTSGGRAPTYYPIYPFGSEVSLPCAKIKLKTKSNDRTDRKQSKNTTLLQPFGRLQLSSWVSCVFMGDYCVNRILVDGYGWLWVVTGDYWVVMGDSCF